MTSSAIGFVSGTGEFFGGGIAPVIAGFVAQHYGIGPVYRIPMIGLGIGVILACCLRETGASHDWAAFNLKFGAAILR